MCTSSCCIIFIYRGVEEVLQELPIELLIQILSYSKTVTVLLCLKQVNKRLNNLITSKVSILDLIELVNNPEELEKIIKTMNRN